MVSVEASLILLWKGQIPQVVTKCTTKHGDPLLCLKKMDLEIHEDFDLLLKAMDNLLN